MATPITTVAGKGAPLNSMEFDDNFINLAATADQAYANTAPAALLAAIKTVDGAGSGLDADLLDGTELADVMADKGDIPDAADLDTYTVTGLYNQTSDAYAAGGSHYPVAKAGRLMVYAPDANFRYQAYQAADNSGIYVRTYNAAAWTAWKELEQVARKGAASGYCDLDGSSLVPLARIPATLTGKDADTLDGSHAAAFATSGHNHDATYAPIAKGVTNGDSHDHAGGDGAQIDHGGLAGLGDDDHTQYIKHALATAVNDFLVASGAGAFIKKTLAETKTILGITANTDTEIPGHAYNLTVQSHATNEQAVSITADYVILQDGSGNLYRASSVSLTGDLDVSGANGLDTGSIAANTGYFIYVIYNSPSTVAALLSTSATSPTMPGGYTYKALVGWCTTDGTGSPYNIEEFIQKDNYYQWRAPQRALYSGSATTPTAFSLGTGCYKGYAVVPTSICRTVRGQIYNHTGATYAFMHPKTFSTQSDYNQDAVLESFYMAGKMPWQLTLEESQTLYYQVTSNSVSIWVTAFWIRLG